MSCMTIFLLVKDMQSFWKVWSAKTGKKVTSVNSINGKTDPVQVAELFKNKFEVCANKKSSISSEGVSRPKSVVVELADQFSVEDVSFAFLNGLKCGKAPGVDNLTTEHIKYCHPGVIMHLCRLFNLILKHSYVPNEFGRGIIVPLIKDKNGDVCNSDNYRGITISPVISKLFEYCLMSKFGSFLYSSELQFGFKKKLGCGPALFGVQHVVNYFISRGSPAYITSVDASKAFDRIDHNKLFNKLYARNAPSCFVEVVKKLVQQVILVCQMEW